MVRDHNQVLIDSPANKVNLNKRLEDIGWGFFLLLIGTLLLLPGEFVSQGAWLIGAGLIMLGLNGIRYLNDISVSHFTVFLGFVALLVGLASFFGLRPPLFAIFLALIGLSIIVRSLFPTRDRPGSNRHSLTHG
jgi:hypothetical protein